MNQPKEAESLETVLERIQGTLESLKGRPTTPPLLQERDSEPKQKAWLDKWLRINPRKNQQLLEMQVQVREFCSGYAKCPASGYRLILHGENGCGKTHTARAISNWARLNAINLPLVNAPGNEVVSCLATTQYVNWPRVIDEMKSGDWEMVERMMTPNLLVIDDIGAEYDPSKIATEKLYLLLEHRERKWMVLTTNVPPEKWEEKFERRISSRLLRNSHIVALDKVPDYNS